MTETTSRAVRAQVRHPIIDADGHFVEIGPLLGDEVVSYVEEIGGAALRDRYLASGIVGLQRHKMGVDDFELLTMIGKGAFGEVCI